MIREILGGLVLLGGSSFALLAAIGIVRMPDILTRMQTTTTSATMGVGLTLLAVLICFWDFQVSCHALVAIFFVYLTSPVGAHLIARAAYLARVGLWDGTVLDEMEKMEDDNNKNS